MAHINPFKHLTVWTRRSIAVGILLCGLFVIPLVYIFQDLEKSGPGSVPASQWNAEQVFTEFQKFMRVMEQHERVGGLVPGGGAHIRKLEVLRL